MKKFIILSFIFAACTTSKPVATSETAPEPVKCQSLVVNGKLFASVYQQKAAEYKALCFQAFNLARLKLDAALSQGEGKKRKAIITDIDETILDNSQYAIHRALTGEDYEPLSWSQWIERSEADTIAGAAHFLRYAASRGVEIFYITNRDEKDRNGTLKNLEIFNLPYADNHHLIMKRPGFSKEQWRSEILASNDVVLLLGDNLADFSSDFEKKTHEDRESLLKKYSLEFGDRFILIPNPVYGDWESTLYDNNYNFSLAERDSIIKAVGKTY